MAGGCGYRTCLVLLFLMLCFVYVADCRGGRGGGRGGYRGGYRSYRYRSGSSGYHGGGGGGGGSTATIIGIVFGCIGGIVALVIIIYCCCGGDSSSDSSSSAVKYSRPEDMKSEPIPAHSATAAPFEAGNPSYSTPHSDQYKTQFNGDAAYNTYPVSPPSYDSAMADDRGSLPYSPNPTSYPSQPQPATAPPVGFESVMYDGKK